MVAAHALGAADAVLFVADQWLPGDLAAENAAQPDPVVEAIDVFEVCIDVGKVRPGLKALDLELELLIAERARREKDARGQ